MGGSLCGCWSLIEFVLCLKYFELLVGLGGVVAWDYFETNQAD